MMKYPLVGAGLALGFVLASALAGQPNPVEAAPVTPEIPLRLSIEATGKTEDGRLRFKVDLENTVDERVGLAVIQGGQPFTVKIFNSRGEIVNREILVRRSSSDRRGLDTLNFAPKEHRKYDLVYPTPDNPVYKRLPDDTYSLSTILPVSIFTRNGVRTQLADSVLLRSNEINLTIGPYAKKNDAPPANVPTQADADKLPLAPETPATRPINMEVGKPALEFSMKDMNGTLQRLSDYKGRKNLLVTFFPKCFTGGCANHLSSLRDVYSELQAADVDVLAVSVDPAEGERGQIEFAKRWKFPFPLIPDTNRDLCLLYGATHDREALASRMSFIIDKQGIVRYIDTDVHVKTHGPDILAKLKELGIGR